MGDDESWGVVGRGVFGWAGILRSGAGYRGHEML